MFILILYLCVSVCFDFCTEPVECIKEHSNIIIIAINDCMTGYFFMAGVSSQGRNGLGR